MNYKKLALIVIVTVVFCGVLVAGISAWTGRAEDAENSELIKEMYAAPSKRSVSTTPMRAPGYEYSGGK